MFLSLEEDIDPNDRASVEAWAEAFDVFPNQVVSAFGVVGRRAFAVRNYLTAMGQIGTRSSSPLHGGYWQQRVR